MAELAAMNPPKKPAPERAPHVPSGKPMLPPMEYMNARIAELHADDLALKAVIAARAKPAAVFPAYEDLARHTASMDFSWAAVLNP